MTFPTGRKALAATLLASLAAACGSASAGYNAPELPPRLLTLAPVKDAPVDYGAVETLAAWPEVTAEALDGTWTIEGGKSRFAELDGRPALQLQRKVPTRIQIATELDPEKINQLRMEVINLGDQGTVMEVVLLSNGRQVQGIFANMRNQATVQELVVNFRNISRIGVPITGVELRVARGGQPLSILSLTAEHRPPGAFLPEASHGGLELVEIIGDSRRATCLTSEMPLAVELPADRPGQALRFSYGIPLEALPPGFRHRLKVDLAFEDGATETRSLEFPEPIPGTSGWRPAELDLGAWAGLAGSATFRLTNPYGTPIVCALTQPRLVEPTEAPPTVLFITSDTHRQDHLGFLEDGVEVATPTLDRLAAEGVVFTNAYSNANSTGPSHSAMLTGLPPRDTGIIANGRRLSDEAWTLAEVYRDAGYGTLAAVSALPVTHKMSGLGQGFERFGLPAGVNVHGSPITLTQLLDWLPDYDGEPLFVWVHIYDAHMPYELHPDFSVGMAEAAMPAAERKSVIEAGTDPELNLAAYRTEITFLDRELERILGAPRMANAAVAFTSDHGEVLDKGLDEHFDHIGLSHATLAVPLILKAPGLEPGQRITKPVETIDLGRTLLQLTGHDMARFPGEDLLTVAREEDWARYAIESHGDTASVQQGKWLLNLRLRGKPTDDPSLPDGARHAVRLFDTHADPECEVNLYEDQPRVAAELRRMVIAWLQDAKPLDWSGAADLSKEELAAALSALGYITSDSDEVSEGHVWFDTGCPCAWCAAFPAQGTP